AASLADTAMKPLPPRWLIYRDLAAASGSSGRGNGIRSLVTNRRAAPGTSTPCESVRVPKSHVRASSVNSSLRPDSDDSDCNGIVSLSPTRRRISSAADLAALRDEKRQSAPPLDA